MFSSNDRSFENLFFEKRTTQDVSPLESFVSLLENDNNSPYFTMSQSGDNESINPRALLQETCRLGSGAAAFPRNQDDSRSATTLLQQLDAELTSLTTVPVPTSNNHTVAYQLASKIAPALVQDPAFRTMFLRADAMNPKKAAQRMIQFFQHKLQLFGADKLGKTITIGDLSDEDRNVLYKGRMQVLKEKDQTLLCTAVRSGEMVNCSSILRVMYYLIMTALKDETVQKQGLVSVVYAMNEQHQSSINNSGFSFDSNTVLACSNLRSALPARYASLHYCFRNDSFQSYINCDRIGLDESTQPSIFLHQASAMELQFALQRQGLPTVCMPIPFVGNTIKTDNHEEWLEAQKFKELLESGDGTSSNEDLFLNGPSMVVRGLEPTPIREGGCVVSAAPTPTPFTVKSHQGLGHSSGMKNAPQVFPNAGAANPLSTDFVGNINFSSGNEMNAVFVSLYGHLPSTANLSFGSNVQQQFQQPMQSLSTPSFVMNHATSSLPLIQPSKYDVLFGRGKVKDHYGNVHLHQLIAMRHDRYEAAERWEKTIIAEEIVSIIRDLGGRFLKPTKDKFNPWMEVDAEIAREKVSHTFRSRRSKAEQLSAAAKRKQSLTEI